MQILLEVEVERVFKEINRHILCHLEGKYLGYLLFVLTFPEVHLTP